ncbi:hypothetical protein [Erwinia psidii]|uniref:hypothetical protein n=1 Tax=Erwinia psidii TaxID=69224 RepID=UPI001F4353A9|nr:hypothetical protein [Erwinia psidii]
MPVTTKDISDHHDYYGITDIPTMDLSHYQQLLNEEAFLWMDHHEFVRSTFSGEILATNREQLDALIKHLQHSGTKCPGSNPVLFSNWPHWFKLEAGLIT